MDFLTNLDSETLKAELFPLAKILTPNIPETEELTGMKIMKTE